MLFMRTVLFLMLTIFSTSLYSSNEPVFDHSNYGKNLKIDFHLFNIYKIILKNNDNISNEDFELLVTHINAVQKIIYSEMQFFLPDIGQ